MSRIATLLGDIGLPARALARLRGRDYFDYPATWHWREWAADATVLHMHNLHGDYFDLRAMPEVTAHIPTTLTLHDAWLLSGHCAHSMDCENWRTGCGDCPYLDLPPSVRRDQTSTNWLDKRRIFAASRIWLVAPSNWLMAKAEASLLADGIIGTRVIPNGIDLKVFRPTDQRQARQELRLPLDARIAIFVAAWGRANPWKDFATVQWAAREIRPLLDRQLVLIIVGDKTKGERSSDPSDMVVPYLTDRTLLAKYLAAADICVHAALAENFSLAIAEALACGTPVVSTRLGAIPEVVRDGQTGLLATPGNRQAFAAAMLELLNNGELRSRMARRAAADASLHLDRGCMVRRYIELYGCMRGA